MSSQALEMKLERERQEKAENLWNQPITQIIEEQNVPVPGARWASYHGAYTVSCGHGVLLCVCGGEP